MSRVLNASLAGSIFVVSSPSSYASLAILNCEQDANGPLEGLPMWIRDVVVNLVKGVR